MSLVVKICCVLLTIASLSAAVEIKCQHKINYWTKRGRLQECLVELLKVSSPDEVVTKLNKHDYTTIKSFFIHQSIDCIYLPKGVEKFLDHLEVLVIAGTGLRQIKSVDLQPFTFLKEIYMNDNQLEILEGDLFKFNPEIMIVNFENNKIIQIGCGLLDPLIRLEEIKFKGNYFYSSNAHTKLEVANVKMELSSQTCEHGDALPQAAALSSPCPETITTTLKPLNCELTQPFLDLKAKVALLELEINKTATELTTTTREFCVRYNDWKNERCKEFEMTTKTVHVDDMTEGYIEAVID